MGILIDLCKKTGLAAQDLSCSWLLKVSIWLSKALSNCMCTKWMEGREHLEDFGHVLDVGDVSWTWFWVSGWLHVDHSYSSSYVIHVDLNSIALCMHVGKPNTKTKNHVYVTNVRHVTKIFPRISPSFCFLCMDFAQVGGPWFEAKLKIRLCIYKNLKTVLCMFVYGSLRFVVTYCGCG